MEMVCSLLFVSNNGKCAWSTDGKTFTNGTISSGSLYGVCYGNGMFVAVSNNGKCAWSEFRIVTAKSFALKDQTYTKTEADDKFVINGTNSGMVNIKAGESYLAISSDDVTFKGQSLIVDTSNFIVNNSVSSSITFKPISKFEVMVNDTQINSEIVLQLGSTVANDYIRLQKNNFIVLSNGNRLSIINNELIFYSSNTTLLHVKSNDILYKETSLLNTSTTITHKAPIDENLTQDNFEIGKPVYMTGKVYVKDSSETGWKRSDSINNVIDCISSVKHTGTWREYLGICVGKYKIRVGLEENEITFASHGDFMVKYSECNVGDTLYVTDDGNINVLNDETPLTLKIQRQIIGLVTEKINDEYCAVFKSN